MANFRDGYLEQGTPIAGKSYDLTLVADNTLVDVSACTILRLSSDSVTATARTFTLSAPGVAFQELLIMFMSGSSTAAELLSTGNCKLVATWTAAQYETIRVRHDGTYWVEVSRKTSAGFVAGSVVNASVAAAAAIDFSKLGALADGNILVGSAATVPTSVAVSGDVTLLNTGATAIGAGKVTEAMLVPSTTAGLGARRTAKAVYDTTKGFTAGAHTLGVTIPAKAFVVGAWYWVETSFTSAGSTATLAISIEGANDVVSAIAINDGSAPWTNSAKPVECIPVIETTSTWLATTVARAITVTTAVQTITAGKLHVFVDYIAYP